MDKKIKNIALAAVLLLLPVCAGGQEATYVPGNEEQTEAENSSETPLLQGIGRWSLKFNTVDLLCTVFNIGLEFDLGKDEYSQSSLSLTARHNWDEKKYGYLPYDVFNVFEIRPEYRKYIRTENISKNVKYWGAYLSGGSYAMKFSPVGKEGLMLGAGASFGFVTPLHEYNKFAVDLEIGGSLGLCFRDARAFSLSEDARSYVSVPDENKSFSPVFWPVLSEVRVAFVFRKVSAKHRYQLTSEQVRTRKEKEEK